VIGSAASVTAGEYIDCLGFWANDREHGQQFKATALQIVAPTTLEGIGVVSRIPDFFRKEDRRLF
jgi:exodeoxyribonuclease V alpha subunit